MRTRPGIGLLALLLLLASPAHAQKQTAYVAPSRETVYSTTEVGHSGPEHLIYVENRSTVPITVINVALYECENVRESCTPTKTNKRVRPGGRTLVRRVRPGSLNMGFRYRFWFNWRPDSAAAASVAAALGEVPDAVGAPASLRYKELTREDFTRLAPRIAALRAEPESLTMEPGEQVRLDRVMVLVVDDSGKALGRTRWYQWSAPTRGPAEVVPPDMIAGRRPGRSRIHFRLSAQAQQLVTNEIEPLEVPVVVLQAPRAGSYRVRVETYGWAPAYGPMTTAATGEEQQGEYAVRFVEELLVDRDIPDFQHARPVSVRTATLGAPPPRAKGQPAEAAIGGVSLGGSPAHPVLGIVSAATPMTTWIQLTVDSLGAVDTATVLVPAEVAPRAKATVLAVMRRLRFAPAIESGKPTCEMLRMQVNVTNR